MTCCVAIKLNDKILLGTDTQLSDGSQKSYLKGGKLVEFGPHLIVSWAGASIISHGLLRFKSTRKKIRIPRSAEECFRLFKPVFENMAKDEFLEKKDFDFDLLIITNKSIFAMDPYSAEEHENYWAIGSGSPYALGRLYNNYSSEKVLLDSLKAANYNDSTVSNEFVIKEIKR